MTSTIVIVTPAETQQLTTLANVKAEIGITATTDDDWLSSLIDRASAAIRKHCNRVFALETVRETFRLNTPAESLALTRWPLVSVASVTEAGTTVATSGYERDDDGGVLYRLSASDLRRCWTSSKVVVEYAAGYVLPADTDTTLPDDVQQAAILLAKAAYHARTRDPLLKRDRDHVEGVGEYDREYWIDAEAIPADVKGLLDPHRQPAMG